MDVSPAISCVLCSARTDPVLCNAGRNASGDFAWKRRLGMTAPMTAGSCASRKMQRREKWFEGRTTGRKKTYSLHRSDKHFPRFRFTACALGSDGSQWQLGGGRKFPAISCVLFSAHTGAVPGRRRKAPAFFLWPLFRRSHFQNTVETRNPKNTLSINEATGYVPLLA